MLRPALVVALLSILLLLHGTIRASPAIPGLSDPHDAQPKFQAIVPNPLDPGFFFDTSSSSTPIEVSVGPGIANTGLVGPDGITPVMTPIWGYGTPEDGYTWPGRTFEVQSNQLLKVRWLNRIPIASGYILTGIDNGEGNFENRSVVDSSFHYCYSLPGYTNYSIQEHGTPIVPHLHGGHTDAAFDGNPEYFFTPEFAIKGPQWVQEVYQYDNSQPAAAIWYHDHALGIVRLNVYTGMAGFYMIRDELDTGKPDNPLKLPAYPYELPLMIQDRMFKENGELFYPAFRGDPYYSDFITGEGANFDPEAPTALAEFFGDHMVVNGKVWPKVNVEPRKYRFRLLNGCDSRFLVIQFVVQDEKNMAPLDFHIIGGDQGLANSVKTMNKVVLQPSGRLDVIVDFSTYTDKQVLLLNEGGDEPFGGDIPGPQVFEHTDKIMLFNVSQELDSSVPDDYSFTTATNPAVGPASRVRRLGLFEGTDQYGRLQPLLGTVDPATDRNYNPIFYPDNTLYASTELQAKQMIGTMTWHAPTTENMNLNDIEEWEIWNLSDDAHPIHLHLVRFDYVSRRSIVFDRNADEDGVLKLGQKAAGDGTYIQEQILVEHDGTTGTGYRVFNPTDAGVLLGELPEYAYHYPMDVVVALPGEVTTIRVKFDKLGRFNYHCHILAHEDHEMMRIFHVGGLPANQLGGAEPATCLFALCSFRDIIRRLATLFQTLLMVTGEGRDIHAYE